MILGAKLLVRCEPAFCDELNLPKSTLTTATANYTVTTTYTSPESSAKEYSVALVTGYPDCSLTRIVLGWTTGLNFTGSIYTLDSLVIQSVSTATSVFKKISEGTSTGFGSYARPGSTTYGSTVVLATGVPYKVRTYTFQGFSFSGSYNQPAYVTNDYPTDTSCCSYANVPGFNYFESATPGPGIPKTYPIAAIFATLRWIGVATAPVAGINLTLRSPGGTVKAPWDIKVKGGSIIMKDRTGTTYSYSGTLAAARTAIQAAGFFTAAIPANIVSTGANPALVSDLQPFKATGIQTISCVTALPIANMGDVLMPSTVGSGYGNFSIGPGFTDDAAGLESFFATPWYAKTGAFVGDYYAKYYVSTDLDPLATNPQPLDAFYGWEKTGGSSNHQEIFAAQMSPGNTAYSEFTANLVEAVCALGDEQPCLPFADPDYCNGNGAAYPLTPYNGALCTPPGVWPDDCPYPGLNGCWCERYDTTYVAPVDGDQTVSQQVSGTFVIS